MLSDSDTTPKAPSSVSPVHSVGIQAGQRQTPSLRVALIAPPYLPIPPQGYGGIERVVDVLARGLIAQGHDVTVFGAPGSTGSYRIITPLRMAPLLGDPASVSDELFHVTSAYLEADRFDVIHDHSGMGPALGSVCSDLIPVVHTLHGPWTDNAQRFYGLIDHRIHLVAISKAQRALNPCLHYAGVVYNGVDLDAHPFNAEKEDFLLFMGRINSEKQPELAIEVARRAKLPLVMIIKRSEPVERDYWNRVVAPRLGSDIAVLDQPPHDEKVKLLGRARAMIFPIDWPEPFGLVMIEAMACGTPVIARPLGAVPEVVDDGVTGFLCASVDQMVAAVGATESLDPEVCRRRVEERFSAHSMVTGYERVYEAAIAESRGSDCLIRRYPRSRPMSTPVSVKASLRL